jgi:hypothetical protein
MIAHARVSRAARGLGCLFCVALWSSPVFAADALLYRIFLHDGSTLVSYGDFARVADRVVFSIPLGGLEGPSPVLHLVSIAESAVDWTRTDRYAEATRARHYATTRGEADFEALSNYVAQALHDVARTKDATRRLALANAVRRTLAAWPSKHHGYRAADVAQLSALLDETVAELRVAAGQSRFDLELVATSGTLPPDEPALPEPTLRESIEQVFTLAKITPDGTERVSLLQTIVARLGDPELDAAWTGAVRAKASAELASEVKTDKAYRDLVTKMVAAADDRASRADVNGIDALVKAVLKADDKLGRLRPQTTAALLATLDGRLDAARRLRLARDAWLLRQDGLSAYRRNIRTALDRLSRSTAGLEQIRQLAGPPPGTLPALVQRVTDAWRDLKAIRPPAEVDAAHGMLVAAAQMAARAATARRMAIKTTNMEAAWEASSAAAGALIMFERAQEELRKLSTPPGQ